MSYPFRLLLSLLAGFVFLFSSCTKKADPVAQPQPGSISGQVLPAGAAATVTATAAGGQATTTTPNAAGSYQLTGLAAGAYALSVTPAAAYIAPAPVAVTVAAGAATTVPVITLALSNGSLSGQVLPAAAVTLVTATGAGGSSTTAVPTAAGGFSFAGLLPDVYTVAYTPATGYLAPTSQRATVIAGRDVVLPAVTVLPTRTALLTGPRWRVTAAVITPGILFNGAIVTDLYSLTPACDRDNFVRFNPNNQYVEDEGPTKCSPSDPQTTTGTWALSAGDTVLTLTGASGGISEILVLSATTLELRQFETLGGITYTIRTTFTAF